MKFLIVKNLAHLCAAIWLVCVVAFFGYCFIVLPKTGSYSQSQGTFLISLILTGIIAFLAALMLYSTHILFLRKKPVVGHSVRSRSLFFLPLMGLLVAVFVFGILGAYRLGAANNTVEVSKNEEIEPTLIPPQTVTNRNAAPVNTAPSPVPTIQEAQQNNQSNLIQCYVYGQTFNLTPEKCRYYQSEEAGANKATQNNDGYVPPYQNYGQSSTPAPTTAPEKYHSTQEACRQSCYATYKNYPDTSLAKQQCVNSCQ